MRIGHPAFRRPWAGGVDLREGVAAPRAEVALGKIRIGCRLQPRGLCRLAAAQRRTGADLTARRPEASKTARVAPAVFIKRFVTGERADPARRGRRVPDEQQPRHSRRERQPSTEADIEKPPRDRASRIGVSRR